MKIPKNAMQNNAVSIDLYQGRNNGDSQWDLPCWGHPISQGVFPLFVTIDRSNDRYLMPIGTTFNVCRFGLLLSALHNIREALRYHRKGDQLLRQEQLPEHYIIDDINLVALHHAVNSDNKITGNIWPLEGTHGAPPTDVIYGFPKYMGSFPFLIFPISFAVPRIGSKVICAGYCETKFPEKGISVNDLKSGKLHLPDYYNHKLHIVEGSVTHIFTKRFASGFGGGPCFVIDAELPHGLSGGPVFNQQHHVCGVVSSGGENFFNRPATIVSLLYPTILTNIKFGASIGPVRLNTTRTISDMILDGSILTDGSEKLLRLIPEIQDGEKFLVCPMIHKDDSDYVYEDFSGFQGGRIAPRESRQGYYIKQRNE